MRLAAVNLIQQRFIVVNGHECYPSKRATPASISGIVRR